MKNFSSPENIHQHTPRPKIDEKRCMGVLDVPSTLSKNFQSRQPHALVSRIEELFSKFNSHTVLGDLGEELLKAKLQEQGWHNVALADEKFRGDVAGTHPETGEIVRFEVKAAKRGSQKGWQFCLNKANKTACGYSDFVFLIVVDEQGKIYSYLVPAEFFGRITKVSVSSHPTAYKGKLAPFRLRSESIDIYQSREIYQLGAKQ
jgi:hypothetical protein